MATVVAYQTLADSATYTGNAWPFGADAVVSATITNGASPPSQACQVVLQMSPDGVTWTEVASRWGLFGPSAVAYQEFPLAPFAGNMMSYGGGYTPPGPWLYYRLVFTGNVGAAVTIAATDSRGRLTQVIQLAATATVSGGELGAFQPPGGALAAIERVVILVTTASTGAANVNVGIAANATTSNSSLIAATSVHTSGAVIDSNTTTSAIALVCPAGDYVTFTNSASTVGLVAQAWIEYLMP